MAELTVDKLAQELSELMEKKLRVRGPDLRSQLRRAGRRLPGWVRKDVQSIVDAQAMSASPKLAKQVNLPRLEAAERRVAAHLKRVDLSERRMTTFLGVLGGLAFSFIVICGLIYAVMRWRGLI